MAELKTIFETCKPRADVRAGTTPESQFAADLAEVVKGTAPREYSDPLTFFSHTHPTRGIKELLKAVCKRVSGTGGEAASLFRLHTQYGGGKTHAMIALIHAVKGMAGVPNVAEFIDPDLLPTDEVVVAAIDGENTAPAEGLTLEGNLRAFTLWGELAYRLGGVQGYERVKEADRNHVAPGADTLRELFAGRPILILLDEVSVYLRKVEAAHPGKGNQFTAFLQALLKAVETSPRAALVLTLAVGKGDEAKDAYRDEHERAMLALDEAGHVAARKATLLNPTEEDETADVLRRRLFESVDTGAAEPVIAAYTQLWNAHRAELPDDAFTPETREQFHRGYPLHPETLEVLTEKLSSLSTFQRCRGMLRLLARTVHRLWAEQPPDAYAIHLHHIDPGFGPIREEITVRLEQGEYTPALKADVAAVEHDEPAVAQLLDQRHYPGQLPITSYIARTAFLNTLAHETAKGVASDRLAFSVCSPSVEPSFIDVARIRFVQEALYLDDRPGAPLRFMVEPNLIQVIRKQMADVDGGEVRSDLNERIRKLFGGTGAHFNLIPFPAGPYEVPDEVGDGRPLLVVLGYEAVAVSSEAAGVPSEVVDIFRHKGTTQEYRDFRNNLVFVVADSRRIENMKDKVRRRLALYGLRKPERIRELADHQQRKINEEFERSSLEIAEAILQCYTHLFYPYHTAAHGCEEPIAHSVIEVAQASDQPGNGQHHVERILRDNKKVLGEGDQPDAPGYVRDQTPLKTKGEVTTLVLRNEFRRAPKLSILLSDSPLKTCIQDGINTDVLIYREGNQVWGRGDPTPAIRIGDDAFVHTTADARKKHLWPRAEPLAVVFSAEPSRIEPGEAAELVVTVTGGVGPYTFTSSEDALTLANTSKTVLQATVAPDSSTAYEVEVRDSHGQTQTAGVDVLVAAKGKVPDKPKKKKKKPEEKPPPPDAIEAQGPLNQALTELWEKARAARVPAVRTLEITLLEPGPAWKVHQAVARLRDTDVVCHIEVDIEGDEIEEFKVVFRGGLKKANTIKSFLDPQIRSASESDFEATYALTFAAGLPLRGDAAEKLQGDLVKYGAGEARVVAQPQQEDR